MTCQDAQSTIMSYLAGEISKKQEMALKSHITQCAACASELQRFRQVWNALDTWEDRVVPDNVQTRILTIAKEADMATREQPQISRWREFQTMMKPLAPVGLGLLAAVLSAGILSSKMNLYTVHPLTLTAVGALWTGIYTLIFYILFSGKTQEAGSWRAFAQTSIIALGLFLGFTLISPVPDSVHFCRYYAITQPILERLSIGGSFFLFGALYALIPMSFAAYFSGSHSGNHPWVKGSLAGVMFVALMAPSIYLQCAPFALGVLLVWFGGALVGSILGGVVGYWFRYRFARS